MGHDANKVKMGSTRNSCRKGSEVFDLDPGVFKAGLAVRRTSANSLSVAKADGLWAGVSLGSGLTGAKMVEVLKAGLEIPVLLELAAAKGNATITAFAQLVSGTADTIQVGATVFTAQAGAATPGTATFQAASSNDATATSLAAQINAHATANTVVKAVAVGPIVNITALGNTTAGNAIALAYVSNGTVGATVSGANLSGGGGAADFVSPGKKVYFSDTSGKADDPNSAATISDAIYETGAIIGIQEDGTEVAVAIISMPGGL